MQACRAEAKDKLQEMEQYRQGLSKALQDKEKNLKAEAKQGASRGKHNAEGIRIDKTWHAHQIMTIHERAADFLHPAASL